MERLKQRIENTTKEFKVIKQKEVTRIFYVPVTSEFESIELWYKQWFPYFDKVLDNIYCWLRLSKTDSREELKKIISHEWRNTMSASTLKDLTASGYRLLDASSQVIFIIDLTKPGGVKKIEETKKVFEELISNLGGHLSFHFSCIAVLRNYDDHSGEIMPPVNLPEFKDWSRQNLDKLFIVDIFNSRATTISTTCDLLYFIGQLVYHLTKKPVEFYKSGESSSFHEWIKKIDPQKDRVTSFSGISIVFPIDYVLQICLVKKGAQCLEKVLFSDPHEGRGKHYAEKLLGEHNFQTVSTLRKKIKSGKFKEILRDPLDIIGREIEKYEAKSFLDDSLHRIYLYKSASANLQGLAETNGKIFQGQLKNITGNLKYSVQDHIGFIIEDEIGSGSIIQNFFEELKKHFSNFFPEKKTQIKQENKDKLIERQEEEIKKLPTVSAMIMWGLLFTTILAVSIITILFSSGLLKIVATGLILIITGSMIFQWFALKRRISNLFLKIESAISADWNLLMDQIENSFIEQIRIAGIDICTEYEKEFSNKLQRFKHIIQFGKEIYDIPAPLDSAFWINAVTSRDEVSMYTEKISNKKDLKPVNILDKIPVIEFLNRISQDSLKELNQFELDILENLAIEFLSESSSILRLSVCDALANNQERLNNLKELVTNYSDPFISINELDFPEKFYRKLEVPYKHCEEIADIFVGSFKSDSIIEKQDSESNFRITLLTFAEGIDINKIEAAINP